MVSTGPTGNWFKNAKNIKGILMDVYGVLYDEGLDGFPIAIKGSVEAVKKLKKAGVNFRFCSNTSTKSKEELAKTLESAGFDVLPSEIFSPPPAARQLLVENKLRPYLLVKPEVLSEFEGIDCNDPNCVVLGDAQEEFSYENLNKAFQVLLESPKPRLIAMGAGKYYKDAGKLNLDVGVFSKALEFACSCQSEVVGKPSPSFFNAALGDMGIAASEALMIGDDIVVDVGGAQACGMQALQVRTGKYREMDEPHPTVKPDGYVDHLLQAIDLYLSHL